MENRFIDINGKNHYVTSTEHAIELIRDTMGHDMADLISTLSLEVEEQTTYEKLKFQSDMESYEGSLEEHQNTFNDIMEVMDKYTSNIEDRKMISVNFVKGLIKEIKKILSYVY